ncbi:hypothetical protein EmuJ_000528100 [Echinococcus multilocularis]|uniref:Uncharacterized protein n=1 Tax=Echinococcus multilocularis TaxID=6211 RepID=A0A068Y6T1_ECHMU|nr:hypothetical protein EmuJ_000528100 [Echinococcus multilocularis]
MIQGEIQESNQVGDVFHEAREHIVASMAKYQLLTWYLVSNCLYRSTAFGLVPALTIITLDSLMSFSVPEDTVYANICLKAIGNGCPTLREGVDNEHRLALDFTSA